MSALHKPVLSKFAQDVAEGLSARQKQIPSEYFYDDLGSSLFEAITLLPEYGLTRADERILQTHSGNLASMLGSVSTVCELGSGSGKKTRYILQELRERKGNVVYTPIDVSSAALAVCQSQLADLADVRPICADWIEGLRRKSSARDEGPLLLLFLGSSIGNLQRGSIPPFLADIKATLRPGDFVLLGADLVKDIDTMLTAYDDPTGVTAAFNLNVLDRVNRELGGQFELRAFAHEVRWNSRERRIEMHLLSGRNQTVPVEALEQAFRFDAGETIWTESSHKFSNAELLGFARTAGFTPIEMWTDSEWPFTEFLWKV
ncbi:MAG: L-histidine N(alpha)-methyltransferase [Acidobacteriota bacterium]|nr:L-histidine N(alpha)-methyltransferase [Acidobacteriota bacterium]